MVVTTQQIYDFCLLDRTYQEYYNIPDQFKCKSKRELMYYYNHLDRWHTRSGTFIFHQRCKQLERFLGGGKEDFYFHVFPDTYQIADRQKYDEFLIYIVAHIREKGVIIEFTHPYTGERIHFIARSHQPYNEAGLTNDVKAYISKHLLLPEGRYRDLQVEHKIPKEKFVSWYKQYKKDLEFQQLLDNEYLEQTYRPVYRMDHQEAYKTLESYGIFDDFESDDFERDDMAQQFMEMCNKDI